MVGLSIHSLSGTSEPVKKSDIMSVALAGFRLK
jgi:hypothetical protein